MSSIYYSRLPIFDTANNTIGYELVYRKNSVEPLPEGKVFDGDEGFINDNYITVFRNKKAFIKFTPELFIKNVPEALPTKTLHVLLDFSLLSNRAVLERCFELKKQGYRMVLENYTVARNDDTLFDFADMVTVDINTDAEIITKTLDKCINAKKPAIAVGVNTLDQFDYARDAGFTYLEGYYFAQPVIDKKQSGGPMIRTFLQILALVYTPEPDISHIAAVISTDPVLTIRLLRLINNICADTGNTIATVHQALVMLGLDKLKEWVYLVGLQRLNRDAPNELLKTALFRASFCERVAKVTPGMLGKIKEVYLLGLISIVTGIDGPHTEKSLSDLPISNEIKDALMGKEGLFGDIFRLTYSYEMGKWEAVDEITDRLAIEKENVANQYAVSVKFVNGFTKLG